jgi:PAS domain S-box-containing protein
MVIADTAGRIELVNRRAEVLFGYAHEELLGQDIEVLVPGRFRAAHGGRCRAFRARARIQPAQAGLELYARRKGGTEFPTETSLSPVEVEGRTLVMAVIPRHLGAPARSPSGRLVDLSQRALLGVDTTSLSAVIPGQEQPFGVLVLHAPRWRRFSEQDVDFVRSVANVLATAIERRLQDLVSRMLLDHERDLQRAAGAVELERLSPRERQILPLLAAGYSNREIAARLGVGTGTVKSYVEHLLQKLGASSRAEAAARAAATWGLLANQRP